MNGFIQAQARLYVGLCRLIAALTALWHTTGTSTYFKGTSAAQRRSGVDTTTAPLLLLCKHLCMPVSDGRMLRLTRLVFTAGKTLQRHNALNLTVLGPTRADHGRDSELVMADDAGADIEDV
jgi:hypothetical protein